MRFILACVALALAAWTGMWEFQILALGYIPPSFTVGMIVVSTMAVLGIWVVINFLVQDQLMRARRRVHSWKLDFVDYVTTFGPAIAYGFGAFILLSKTGQSGPSYQGVNLAMNEVQQFVLAAFGLFHLKDILNLFFGRQVDELVATAHGVPVTAGSASNPSSAGTSPAPHMEPTPSMEPGQHAGLAEPEIERVERRRIVTIFEKPYYARFPGDVPPAFRQAATAAIELRAEPPRQSVVSSSPTAPEVQGPIAETDNPVDARA